MDHENRESMEEIRLRISNVTDDLRVIQRELNCAAMQAPTDPELMEALANQPEMESIQVLKSALDQMRHFLWFYVQIMTNESDEADKLRQTMRQKHSDDFVMKAEASLIEKIKQANDQTIIRYLAEAKNRKPN